MYRLDICTLYFYEPLLFQIFVSWDLKKCRLSLVYYHFYHAFTVKIHADNNFNKYVCFRCDTVRNQLFY